MATTTMGAAKPRRGWTTRDAVLVAVLAVVFGFLYMHDLPPLGPLPLNPLVILLGVVIMFYAVFGWQAEVSAGK